VFVLTVGLLFERLEGFPLVPPDVCQATQGFLLLVFETPVPFGLGSFGNYQKWESLLSALGKLPDFLLLPRVEPTSQLLY
jgi:hypothetical protein